LATATLANAADLADPKDGMSEALRYLLLGPVEVVAG
jgi:hypothetical protein